MTRFKIINLFLGFFTFSAVSYATSYHKKLCMTALRSDGTSGGEGKINGVPVEWQGEFSYGRYFDLTLPILILKDDDDECEEYKNKAAYKKLSELYSKIVKYDKGVPNKKLWQVVSKTFQTDKVCFYDVKVNDGYYGENAYIESINPDKIEISNQGNPNGLKTITDYTEWEDHHTWYMYYVEKYDLYSKD
ncbi:hypothetical protein N9N67_00830 [Bacteriovoracaceae bacterium]|nr:hypothetical protein [Bacteriovoracaceae bacterium]